MAKVVIILKDLKDGEVDCKVNYTPALEVRKDSTPAQRLSSIVLRSMQAACGKTQMKGAKNG